MLKNSSQELDKLRDRELNRCKDRDRNTLMTKQNFLVEEKRKGS